MESKLQRPVGRLFTSCLISGLQLWNTYPSSAACLSPHLIWPASRFWPCLTALAFKGRSPLELNLRLFVQGTRKSKRQVTGKLSCVLWACTCILRQFTKDMAYSKTSTSCQTSRHGALRFFTRRMPKASGHVFFVDSGIDAETC